MSIPTPVRLFAGSVQYHGSCNACLARPEDPEAVVYVFRFGGRVTELRLCRSCLLATRNEIGHVLRRRGRRRARRTSGRLMSDCDSDTTFDLP